MDDPAVERRLAFRARRLDDDVGEFQIARLFNPRSRVARVQDEDEHLCVLLRDGPVPHARGQGASTHIIQTYV